MISELTKQTITDSINSRLGSLLKQTADLSMKAKAITSEEYETLPKELLEQLMDLQASLLNIEITLINHRRALLMLVLQS